MHFDKLSDREWSDAGVDLLGFADQRRDLLWWQRRIGQRDPDGRMEFSVLVPVEQQCNCFIYKQSDRW